MIYDKKSKVFRKFLRALTADELVKHAARLHACKHHHPILTERQAARFYEMEATRRKRIEKTQWPNWDEDKPQLYMDTLSPTRKRQSLKTTMTSHLSLFPRAKYSLNLETLPTASSLMRKSAFSKWKSF